MPKPLTYFIKTFGCAANEADSERLAAVMENRGYRIAKRIEEADEIIINTCSVRESAENRVFGLVNNLIKKGTEVQRPKGSKNSLEDPLNRWTGVIPKGWKGKKPKIVLTGCMVGSAKGKRRRYTMRQLKLRLPRVDGFKAINELLGKKTVKPKRLKTTSALVPIMEGCSHFCSYCVVPFAREKEISRSFEEIVCEVEELANQGYRQITLIGQNVNSYGKDFLTRSVKKPAKTKEKRVKVNTDKLVYRYQGQFAKLLKSLHKIKEIEKISFLTSNPWDLTDEIIKAMTLPKIDRYLHLPVQSGDDEILKKMNRGYSAAQYIKLVEKIRKKIPDIKIGTDIIVGFPGETKKAFENTVKLCQKVGFSKVYVARYSPRPGTAATKLKDNVSPAEKRRRWRLLDKMINK
ncbi:MiaB/RimO family radical SAM methylthiotransferase [Patescibacteria group bacterium]